MTLRKFFCKPLFDDTQLSFFAPQSGRPSPSEDCGGVLSVVTLSLARYWAFCAPCPTCRSLVPLSHIIKSLHLVKTPACMPAFSRFLMLRCQHRFPLTVAARLAEFQPSISCKFSLLHSKNITWLITHLNTVGVTVKQKCKKVSAKQSKRRKKGAGFRASMPLVYIE